METAVFGGGCFWCTEAIFKALKGVSSVLPGYSGGHVDNPTYEQVSAGNSGHAESIEIQFDPTVIKYRDLLEVFFSTHDPTTMYRQGHDVGEQYRSVIFYTSPEQQRQAREFIVELEQQQVFGRPVVTQIKPFTKFYAAEDYHKNYLEKNPDNPYCQVVINPKLAKFKQKFARMLK